MDSCLTLPPSDSTSVTTTVTSAGGALQVDSSLLMITDSPSTEAGSSLPTGGATPIPSHLNDPIRSARPLAVSAALGTVIDQVITERLETTTAGLVEPTIRGIINAYIPRLTELMESHFVTLTAQASRKAAPCKGKNRKSHSKSCEGDYDSDDDEAAVVGRWKKPGPWGKMNHLHVSRDCRKSSILLIYVCRQPSVFTFGKRKIIPSKPKDKLPASAPIDTVRAFNQDGISPPHLENITLDWHCSPLTSSHWNSEAISILLLNFYKNLKGAVYQDIVFDEKTMSLQAIRKLCEQKLVRMHQAHRTQAKIDIAAANKQTQVMVQIAAKEEKHQKGDRMIARHHGVCYPFKLPFHLAH